MEIHIKDIIFQAINFGVILVVLTKFLYKPILKTLDERAAKIKEGLEAAEKNLKLQSQAETKEEEILKSAKKQATDIVKEAKKEASEIITTAKAKAKADAKKQLVQEKEAFQAQMAKEAKQLEKQFKSLVVKASESVIRESVSGAKLQQKVVDEQIKALSPKLFN